MFSSHPDGNIILAADYSGRIKVFRQDCAYNKRPSDWDATSTFSKKLLGRSNSARHSIASSIGRESKTPSERILAWRSSVTGTELANLGSQRNGSRNRTPSPRKSSFKRQSRYSSPVNSPEAKTESGYATPLSHNESEVDRRDDTEIRNIDEAFNSPSDSHSGSSYESDSPVDGKDNGALPQIPPQFNETSQSNAFWTKGAEFVRNIKSQRLLSPNYIPHADEGGSIEAMRRKSSVPSALSSDLASLTSNEVTPSREAEESEVLRCPRCRGTNFRATKTKGKQKLACVRCDTVVG